MEISISILQKQFTKADESSQDENTVELSCSMECRVVNKQQGNKISIAEVAILRCIKKNMLKVYRGKNS